MSEWVERQLGDVAATRRGIGYTDATLRTRPDQGIPYLNMKSFLKDGGYNSEGLKYFAGAYGEQDVALASDVLIANTDVTPSGDIIGVPALLPLNLHATGALFSHHVTRIRPTQGLLPRFLYFALCTESSRRAMLRIARGTTVLMLDATALKRVSVRFPVEIELQERIASILASLDHAIEVTEALIDRHQQIKAGLMHDLFTRGVLPDGRLRPPREHAPELYRETKLGWIPNDWCLTTCEAVCEQIIDCKNRTPPKSPDGFPVIRTPNVRDGEFQDADLLFTDARSYLTWTARGKPIAGDVVITREAPVGEVCMIPERHPEACLGQRMMLYRPDQSLIDPHYFLFALQSRPIQNRLDLISGGSTVGHVRVGDIRSLWMFMPKSMSEQTRIADALWQTAERLSTERALRDKLQRQKLGLMQDLLTGKVPVSVHEPAVPA